MKELYEDIKRYKEFTMGSYKALIDDAEEYFDAKNYHLDVVDVIIPAAAEAFKINLFIFEKIGGVAVLVRHLPQREKTSRDIYLMYDHSHYNAIVKNEEESSSPKPSSPKPKPKPVLNIVQEEKVDEIEMWVSDEENCYPSASQSTVNSDMECEDDVQIQDPPEVFVPGSVKKKKHCKNRLDTSLFFNLPEELVDRLPWDVTGNHIYKVKCKEDDWYNRQLDGHCWKSTSSTRKGLDGTRKFGTCKGSHICRNPQCPKWTTEKVRNKIDFQREAKGSYTCSSCGYYAVREKCTAIKVTEYDRSQNTLTIYHQGNHTCTCQPNLIAKKQYVEDNVLKRDLRNTPREMKIDLIGYYLASDEIDKAWEVAEMMDDSKMLEKIRYTGKQPGQRQFTPEDEVESMKNIKKLKETTDKKDKYHIYKIGCKAIGSEASYVFKSSKQAGLIALKMDESNQEENNMSELVEEPLYMDGIHSRCKNYKTLTLWMYHPGMKKIMRLASMECERENTENVKLFLQTFNSMLAEIKGDSDYIFNPKMGFYCDEAGAFINAIEQVYGQGMVGRIKTCQWHFKHDARLQMKNVKVGDKETFEQSFNRLCYCSTATEYEKVSAALEDICERNNIMKWFKWWKARRFHIVPAFRGFNLSGLNMAETGHSMMAAGQKKLWLSVAAWKDTCSMIIQDSTYMAFCNNTGRVSGKGLNLIQSKARQRQEESHFIQSCCDALETGDIDAEVNIDSDPSKFFLSQKRAKHKFPIHSDYSNIEQEKKRKKKKTKNQAGKSKSKSKSTDDNSSDRYYDLVPEDIENEKLNENPPTLVHLAGLISRCYGCQLEFDKKNMQKPKDFVFKFLTFRTWPTGRGQWRTDKNRSPTYYHATDLACLRRMKELKKIEMDAIYCTNKTWNNLTLAHIEYLKSIKLYDHLKVNRAALCQT